MKIDQLPPIESDSPRLALEQFGAAEGRAAKAWFRAMPSWDRRTFMRATVGAGMGVGLAALGWLPPVRKARASHLGTDGYEISESCHYGDYSASCSDPCDFSPLCGHCCVTNSSDHFHKWHRANGTTYRLRKNDCVSSPWDGWKWTVSGCCGGCQNPKYRCHDGRYCSDGTLSTCSPTICKWLSNCPGSC